MNPCPGWKDRLIEFALGAVPAPEARAVEAHIAGCAGCSCALGELRGRGEEISKALREFMRQAEPPPNFCGRVLASLDGRSQTHAWHSRRVATWAAAAAFVLLVATAVGLQVGKGRRGSGDFSSQALTGLSAWRSPTEGLLRSPGDELLKSTPRLGEIYFRLEPTPKHPTKEHGGNKNES